MRHFNFLTDAERASLFLHEPGAFSAGDDPSRLAIALGATLYTPASRPALADSISRRTEQGVLSAVVCLEDAVADHEVGAAQQNLLAELHDLARRGGERPLLFVRVRSPEQIPTMVAGLGDDVFLLAGFVLPKFTEDNGAEYLDAVAAAGDGGHRLFAMPVLESPQSIHVETRIPALLGVRDLLQKYREIVLAVRLGATDLSAAYGLRRARDISVYDIGILADVIADVVNVLGRADASGHVITGPVWEYFPATERIFKPLLRESPFVEHADRALRAEIMAHDLDGLIREVVLDKANGLTGKTVIHPTHVAAVHALSVVTHEEYCDAVDVLGTGSAGGVTASSYANKMNESKPHSAWAGRTIERAAVFGVAHPGTSFVDLLGAGLNR